MTRSVSHLKMYKEMMKRDRRVWSSYPVFDKLIPQAGSDRMIVFGLIPAQNGGSTLT